MDQVQVFKCHFNMEGHRVCGLGDPQHAQDAMTRGAHDRAMAELRAEIAALREAIGPAKLAATKADADYR